MVVRAGAWLVGAVSDTATANPGRGRFPAIHSSGRCSHIAPVSHGRGTSRPWIYRCYKLTIISRYISTCACALSTIRVPVAGARETGGHLAGLAPMEGKQDQGECELGGLHVGFRALSDTPTLIFWYIMDILSEKVHPYREANIKRIQIKLAFVRFLFCCWGERSKRLLA